MNDKTIEFLKKLHILLVEYDAQIEGDHAPMGRFVSIYVEEKVIHMEVLCPKEIEEILEVN